MKESPIANSAFRRANPQGRREMLRGAAIWDQKDLEATEASAEIMDLAQVMVENAVGVLPVPLGVAPGFLIDGQPVDIPMAVEEPSVIAAASYAGALLARHGGLRTSSHEPVMTGQIYVDFEAADHRPKEPLVSVIEAHEPELARILEPILEPMAARGGGYRGMVPVWMEELGIIRLHIHIDVRDAMGANLINTCAEALRHRLEQITGGSVLMAILSNRADQRVSRAEFALPLSSLARGRFKGQDLAQRIVRAAEIAAHDPSRGVTHNKGIMNGISSLALATANDTRAIEAACHAWAARRGRYEALSSYRIEGDRLIGSLEAPLPFAVVGGGVGFHPAARAALKLLGNPSAVRLSSIAAALGLAQNFAALAALTGEGIQSGHMKLHAERLAYSAGARGSEIAVLAAELSRLGVFNTAAAAKLLAELRGQSG